MGRRAERASHCKVARKDKARINTGGLQYYILYRRFLTILPLQLAATVDILPTVMKLAGAKLPDVTLDGVDMSPILFDNDAVR